MLVSFAGFVGTSCLVVAALGALTLRRHAWVGASIAAIVLVGVMAPCAHAAEVRNKEDATVQIAADESIDDTVFLSGKTVIVAGVVDGDVFAAAERVEVTGTVRGNLYCAGETLSVSGVVAGNVHAVGKSVEINAQISGSAFLAGQNVTLAEAGAVSHDAYLAGELLRVKGHVGRGLYFGGQGMEISGSIARSVRGGAKRFAVSAGGSIGGDVHVTVPAADAAQIDSGAQVNGETTIDVKVETEDRPFAAFGFYLGVVARTLALLLLGLLLAALFPTLVPATPRTSLEALRNIGIGFVVAVATPVALLIVAMTVIGIPIAIGAGLVYALLMYLSTLVVAYFAAQWALHPAGWRAVLWTGLGLLVILLVVEIPVVGPGLSFLVHLFGVGCLVMHLRGRFVAAAV
jgi:cytoskeletal protein CcmA (bactofilin family)